MQRLLHTLMVMCLVLMGRCDMKKIGSAKMAKHDANRYVFVPVMTDEVKWREPIKPHVWKAMLRVILNRRIES